MQARSLHQAHLARRTWPIVGTLALPLLSTRAQAAVLRACRPTDSPLFCRLNSLLTLLYVAAVILGLLLIVAVLAAVRAYKRKARKLTPDEITPDAQ